MSNANDPLLKQLGLDQPTKFTQGKISLESLQRQSESESESASARSSGYQATEPSNPAMDMMAGLLSLILPGSGHLLKGHPLAGAVWCVLLLSLYLISSGAMAILWIFGVPFFLVAIVIHVICIARAMKA